MTMVTIVARLVIVWVYLSPPSGLQSHWRESLHPSAQSLSQPFDKHDYNYEYDNDDDDDVDDDDNVDDVVDVHDNDISPC